MITEDYVSFEIAKLLKEKDFKEWCFKCYGIAVRHNGQDISFDEECELKDKGRENEIEYIEGDTLYDYGCNNRDKDAKVWAAPTLWVTMKWLRKIYNLHIIVVPISFEDGIFWEYKIVQLCSNNDCLELHRSSANVGFDTCEEVCEAAIKYTLENLI